jgi:hypothetical protein
MQFTINGHPASLAAAQAHFFAAVAKNPTPELIAMCPHGLPLVLGDLMHVWYGIETTMAGWEDARAEIEKSGVGAIGSLTEDGAAHWALMTRTDQARSKIAAATNLAALLAALRDTRDLPAEAQAEIDWSDLPVFGGEESDSTLGVWSWDAESLIVGTCADDIKIVSRADWEGA